MHRSFDFINCMDNCEVTDLGFVGPRFTWCNNQKPRKKIWKRLDRVFINDQWTQLFQNNIVMHLVRKGYDHIPLLITYQKDQHAGIKYFRFLDFWTDQPTFMQFVEEAWNTQVTRNSMWILQQKIKILSRKLTQWSREVVGNVFEQEELNRGQVEYIKWIGMQETLLKQKAQFRDHEILENRPCCIINEDNDTLTAIPDLDEIREEFFSMSADNSAGPDGYNSSFFHKCWDIIKNDIKNFVQVSGMSLTKFYSHTCLVLIPKVDSQSNFSNLRSISLSNFFSKIISKILSIRLNPLLSKLIWGNQSGFIKERMITENVLLAHELDQGINHSNMG
ncbi:uncharacterized protein [Nicotiana tomentosiformis]|uniref:uncharacterized protein n=1 Tax=Nicotiana tomentosiformis TaxID=4098 RepID=UPI00388C6178